ncbi:MAG: hypothetical protein QM761_10320 [Pseudoxanthomonas sp.]
MANAVAIGDPWHLFLASRRWVQGVVPRSKKSRSKGLAIGRVAAYRAIDCIKADFKFRAGWEAGSQVDAYLIKPTHRIQGGHASHDKMRASLPCSGMAVFLDWGIRGEFLEP